MDFTFSIRCYYIFLCFISKGINMRVIVEDSKETKQASDYPLFILGNFVQ